MNMRNFLRTPQPAMQTLYDSESYAVVHMHTVSQSAHPTSSGVPSLPELSRHGFEIVDKRAGKEVYLDGLWAELFQQHIVAWQDETPTQEEVEDTLASYAALAQMPLGVH